VGDNKAYGNSLAYNMGIDNNERPPVAVKNKQQVAIYSK